MVELSEEGRRVVEALLGAPLAWQSPAELASATGLDVEATTDLLATLDVGGWLAPWEREPDVVVTLSVAAAAKLGVRLVESGRHESPRWASVGDPDPPAPKATGVFRDERAAWLERVVDPSASAEEAAERAEEVAERHARPPRSGGRFAPENPPTPTLLVGFGLTPWPGPGDGRKASCPACGSKRLGPSSYCLYCDRWGLDHLLLEGQAPRVRLPRDPENDARRGDLERRARKARRRARRRGQSAAAPRKCPRRTLL